MRVVEDAANRSEFFRQVGVVAVKFYFGIDKQHQLYNDEWIKHQPEHKPFEISLEEILPIVGADEENISGDEKHIDSQVNSLQKEIKEAIIVQRDVERELIKYPFPYEVKEVLRQLENKAYKSPTPSNLGTLGRMKLIRKAKVLAFLYRKSFIS